MVVCNGQNLPPTVATLELLRLAEIFSAREDIVWLSVDIEWHEGYKQRPLEVGWTWVCTETNGTRSYDSQHYIVEEFQLLRNGQYVPDRKLNFRFGKSQTKSMKAIVEELQSQLGAIHHRGPTMINAWHSGTSARDIPSKVNSAGYEGRRIALLGHSVEADLQFLAKSGVKGLDPLPPPNERAATMEKTSSGRKELQNPFHPKLQSGSEYVNFIFDTKEILRAIVNNRMVDMSLEKMAQRFGVDPFLVHNAGNDARYTAEALFKMLAEYRSTTGHVAAELPQQTGTIDSASDESDIYDYL